MPYSQKRKNKIFVSGIIKVIAHNIHNITYRYTYIVQFIYTRIV